MGLDASRRGRPAPQGNEGPLRGVEGVLLVGLLGTLAGQEPFPLSPHRVRFLPAQTLLIESWGVLQALVISLQVI